MSAPGGLYRTQRHLTGIPSEVPPGHVVVHSGAEPPQTGRYRARSVWLAVPSDTESPRRGDELRYRIEVCDCGWAPRLGTHYRVVQS